MNSVTETKLADLWERIKTAPSVAVKESSAGALSSSHEALLYIVGLLVRAPRNDVFLEQVCSLDVVLAPL